MLNSRCAFEVKIPKSSSPNVAIFKKYQQSWHKIDKNYFLIGITDQIAREKLIDV